MLGLCKRSSGSSPAVLREEPRADSTSHNGSTSAAEGSRRRGRGETGLCECIATDLSFCRGHHALGLLMAWTGELWLRHFVPGGACTEEDADAAGGPVLAGPAGARLVCLTCRGVLCAACARRRARLLVRRQLAIPRRDWTTRSRRGKGYPRRLQGGPLQAPRHRAFVAGAPRKAACRSPQPTKDVKAATKKWVKASYQFGARPTTKLPRLPPYHKAPPHVRFKRLTRRIRREASFAGHTVNWREVYEAVVRGAARSRATPPGGSRAPEGLRRGLWSATPMQSGQLKVVRYAKYIPDALEVVKETLRRNVPPGEDDFVERINEAITLAEVHELCGKRDFWCTAPCASEKTGEDLGGTRITLQATQHGGFDFSIRTPGTPKRWKLYDANCSTTGEAY